MRLAAAFAVLAAACSQPLELLPQVDGGAAVGVSCSGSCPASLTCYTTAGPTGNPAILPDGLCSRPCASAADCPNGQCDTIEGTMLCLSSCNPSLGVSCRSGYSCCANQLVTTGPGACGPTSTNFCGN